MKKLILASLMMLAPVFGWASGHAHLESANIDLKDQASLQRGAKYFVNYCMGCHSAKYARYNRMGKDIGLTATEVKTNLIFDPETKVGALMTTSMSASNGEAWFGTQIPDLTLVTRNKGGGPDWLYTYLLSFYLDESRPYGVNNRVFPDVGMPHVLVALQGTQKAVYHEDTDAAGNPTKVFDHFEIVTPGLLSTEEYETMVRDLVNFLTYMGEPVRLERQVLGIYVLIFLAIFFVLAYLLKKEYWKDVH